MKKLVTLLIAFVFALSLALPFNAEARTHRAGSSKGHSSYKVSKRSHKLPARGYFKKHRTYVKAHKQSAPPKSKGDNKATKGNANS